MKKLTATIFAISLLALIGCGNDDSNAAACPQGCPFGQVCGLGGVCVAAPGNPTNPTNPTAPGPGQCASPMQACGARCVDTASDPMNCGGCGVTCGANADCVLGQCACASTATNCNGSFSDGCECAGACDSSNPTQCGSPSSTAQCDPTVANSCNSSGSYCDNSSGTALCQACPAGFTNCDGTWSCECQGSCNGNQCQNSSGGSGQQGCDPSQANACGSNGAFCDSATKQCAACPTGYTNCDGQWSCECQGSCNGSQCQQGTGTNPGGSGSGSGAGVPCSPTQYNACGDATWNCDPGTNTCKQCSNGILGLFAKRNCDGIGGCETSGKTCSTVPGGTPPGGTPGGSGGNVGQACSAMQTFSCGNGNTAMHCSAAANNTCQMCPSGTSNCDGYGGCETPGYTCSNAGVGSSCNASTPFACGTTGYCDYSGRCQSCGGNMANCDGQSNNACEAPATACSGSGSGTWDVTLVSVSVTAKDASNSDWDSWFGDPLPDVYVYVSAGGLKFAHSRTQSNTTYAHFEERLLTGVTTQQLTSNGGISISVRDEDAPGGYPYNLIGSCNYQLYSTQGTTEQIIACGPQVISLKLRFTRR